AELVGQARAATRLDGDAEEDVVAPLLLHQGLGLGRSGVGQDGAVGSGAGRGLVLNCHRFSPWCVLTAVDVSTRCQLSAWNSLNGTLSGRYSRLSSRGCRQLAALRCASPVS